MDAHKLDFFQIKEKATKEGVIEVYPDFIVGRSKDLMIRGKQFYAIWDCARGLWSTDEYDVTRMVDAALWMHRDELAKRTGGSVRVSSLKDFSSGGWRQFRNYMSNVTDHYVQLDEKLTFANTDVKQSDYVSRRLPYSLEQGDHSAFDEIVNTLYKDDEARKIIWAIGAILSGDSKHIQKFLVFYGPPGSGKGTILAVVMSLFESYYTTFEAKALVGNNNAFATEAFRDNPLVAIQGDGDLSKIEDNTKLNSIVSHEPMTINEKFKPSYTAIINAFLMLGTNSPVKFSDAKSGMIRRVIDVQPSGKKIATQRYQALMSQIGFELGAIAWYCLEEYRKMGKDYYEQYRATEMMLETDVFYNYIEQYYETFRDQDGVTLDQAYMMYKQFCDDSGIEYRAVKFKFREELRNYFENFEARATVDGIRVRSWYSGFKTDRFKPSEPVEAVLPLVMDEVVSIFDSEFANQPAQYASDKNETPTKRWDDVETTLTELDTSRIHYVKVPENHIVIDFDLKDETGEKSAELNLKAASQWPPTYSEFSKGGGGIHLHYTYLGDTDDLSSVYSDGIEVKVFRGNSSLRRRLSKCNNIPVATISSGLPIKEKKVITSEKIQSEKSLRNMIERNLRKEIHSSSAQSVDFIKKILDDAYASDLQYDLSDMQNAIIAFANNSSNQSMRALKTVTQMKFKSEGFDPDAEPDLSSRDAIVQDLELDETRIVFFDCEVYPNLFLISWKYEDSDEYVHMINPKPHEVEHLSRLKLVGFNCRRYDNHILYARIMGASIEELYRISQKLINGEPNAYFANAYDLSYADIYDFTTKRQSLKKYETELGIPHKEMDIPWDEPVPEEMWQKVIDYCDNDVMATEATFKSRLGDFQARQILAGISGLKVNATTANHTARIIFGDNRKPQADFVYTDLSEEFPGYTFNRGKSNYKDENPGEGGYVYAEPGMYQNVALLDVASMHPTTIKNLNLFGPYTKNFVALMDARLAIKRRDFDVAGKMFGGALKPYLKEETAKALSDALKIAINTVYGLTGASFPNVFRDPRNRDNIVAKRGALFMIDLKLEVQARGFTVAHIKTDSIKIPNATPEIIEFVFEYGRKFGYEFEHEATYDKMALVNDAVYIAQYDGHWDPTGAQFAHPYVYKTLFSHEPIEFKDMCETKQVQSSKMYLDFTESYDAEAGIEKEPLFVGKIGVFVPIREGRGGGVLVKEKDDKFVAVTGTKDRRWLEADTVKALGKEDDIDMEYFRVLVDKARDNLAKYGDVEWFLS